MIRAQLSSVCGPSGLSAVEPRGALGPHARAQFLPGVTVCRWTWPTEVAPLSPRPRVRQGASGPSPGPWAQGEGAHCCGRQSARPNVEISRHKIKEQEAKGPRLPVLDGVGSPEGSRLQATWVRPRLTRQVACTATRGGGGCLIAGRCFGEKW